MSTDPAHGTRSTPRGDPPSPIFQSRADHLGHVATVQQFPHGLGVGLITKRRTKAVLANSDCHEMAAALLRVHPQALADALLGASPDRNRVAALGEINGRARSLYRHLSGEKPLHPRQAVAHVDELAKAARLAVRENTNTTDQEDR